jgi:hypothetical protein
MKHHLLRALTVMLIGLEATSGQSQDTTAETPHPFKLTTGLYQYSSPDTAAVQALDINLRHSSALGNVWVGHFATQTQDLTQDRVGWDHSLPLQSPIGEVRLMPSVQLATGGTWNGSFGIETGEHWFVGTGLGRTNLRDSVSLNFDPNDSLTLSGGYRWPNNQSLSFLLVRDNRLNPDQRHLHLILRTPVAERNRLTIDLLMKSGLVDGDTIERTGLSITHDWPRWFVRVSYDPKANFASQDLWRLSVGTRF